ncbi:MAG: iron export ABC transporter permease subunit FetB [Veillonella sp.]|nr:iron export ABC transporter permease subunit FetB [Veillonella sp.]
MQNFHEISNTSLLMASSLVFITMLFSYRQELKLEKEILISAARATVQLIVMGYILDYLFGYSNPLFTVGILLVMLGNAAYNAAKRGKGVPRAIPISFLAIGIGAAIVLSILVFSGVLQFTPYQMIPVGGMVISGAMVAIGLCYKQLVANFVGRREEIEIKLALGATAHQASHEILRDVVKTGMQPTIDSAKTLGIVSLPGMMTGLILAGLSPIEAVKYQIMVTFMSLATTAMASFIASYLAYRGFYNERKQLKRIV